MKHIPLFYPYVPESARKAVDEVLRTRWIGQGPKVTSFENRFKLMMGGKSCIATGSGTDALHLAYLLANIMPGDEVIAPVFTCTATNMPLLWMGTNIKFADVDPATLNISKYHVSELISGRTKAVVCVHYGGCPCDIGGLKEITDLYGIPLIEDAAQALGAKDELGRGIGCHSEFAAFSFQAIKHITTGDGGMLVLKDSKLEKKAKRMRWFGIDREAKLDNAWDNAIWDVGYKYQMTDIAAAMGIEALKLFDETLKKRQGLYFKYCELLKNNSAVKFHQVDGHGAWLFTVFVDSREDLKKKLSEHRIESGQVHYRNDRYKIFERFRGYFPGMDSVEDKYLVLPLHMNMDIEDVEYICEIINRGW